MTGWNLPPGVSVRDLPGESDFDCEVCCRFSDDCICPECIVCGFQGAASCYRAGHLEISDEQARSYDEAQARWQEESRLDHEAYLRGDFGYGWEPG